MDLYIASRQVGSVKLVEVEPTRQACPSVYFNSACSVPSAPLVLMMQPQLPPALHIGHELGARLSALEGGVVGEQGGVEAG